MNGHPVGRRGRMSHRRPCIEVWNCTAQLQGLALQGCMLRSADHQVIPPHMVRDVPCTALATRLQEAGALGRMSTPPLFSDSPGYPRSWGCVTTVLGRRTVVPKPSSRVIAPRRVANQCATDGLLLLPPRRLPGSSWPKQ